MKIIKEKTCFEELDYGTIFEDNGFYYLKIADVKFCHYHMNAVNLRDGYVHYFNNNAEVNINFDATIIIN